MSPSAFPEPASGAPGRGFRPRSTPTAPPLLVWFLGLALLVSVLGTAPSPVMAAESTSTFIAVADAQVTESAPNTNYAAAALRADGGSDPDVESYLRFTVSGLVYPVVQATLRLYASTGTVDGPAVYATSSSWTESTITWAGRPARVGGAVADSAGIAASSWVEYNVTSLVTGNGTVSLALATVSNDGIDFHAREGVQQPQLVVRSSSTPLDTAPPGPPSGVSASAANANQVVLTWTAAIDDVGTTGYEVYRDGARLASIAPATSYTDLTAFSSSNLSYRLRARDAAGNWSALSPVASVATPAGDGVPLVAAGDIATCGQPGPVATAALLDSLPGVIAALGDLAYESGTVAEFRDCYGPTWGRHRDRTRPAAGNHEYASAGAAPYYAYFGAAAGDPTKGYYSYELGTWHVVVINSNCAAIGGCGTGSPQELWLRADLAAHPASCTVAYWHHPLFTSGTRGGTTLLQPIWQALYQGGADLVLSGHDHHYERFAPQTSVGVADPAFGLREFIVGTGGRGGASLLATATANSEVIDGATFGVLRLELRPSGYTWGFVPEAGKVFTDTGVSACHAAPSAPPPPPPPPAGTTVTVAAVADSRVLETNPSTNYGTSSSLRTDGAADPDVESYLRFTISGVSGVVQSAKLRVYAYSGTVDGPAVYSTTSGWTETGLTWTNRPARSGGALADRGAIAVSTWVEYDVTVAVVGNGTYSFVLATSSSDGVDFRSRNYGTASLRPQLVVTFTP